MSKELIGLDGVGMTYEAASGPVEALAGISLRVGAGEFVSLVGPSGCGKSTLLRIVAGLRPATIGTVTVAGRAVRQPIPDVGMVFQAPVLLKWRSILQNVMLPAELAGADRKIDRIERARFLRPAAKRLGDAGKRNRSSGRGCAGSLRQWTTPASAATRPRAAARFARRDCPAPLISPRRTRSCGTSSRAGRS